MATAFGALNEEESEKSAVYRRVGVRSKTSKISIRKGFNVWNVAMVYMCSISNSNLSFGKRLGVLNYDEESEKSAVDRQDKSRASFGESVFDQIPRKY